jgi:hypothetical protein
MSTSTEFDSQFSLRLIRGQEIRILMNELINIRHEPGNVTNPAFPCRQPCALSHFRVVLMWKNRYAIQIWEWKTIDIFQGHSESITFKTGSTILTKEIHPSLNTDRSGPDSSVRPLYSTKSTVQTESPCFLRRKHFTTIICQRLLAGWSNWRSDCR